MYRLHFLSPVPELYNLILSPGYLGCRRIKYPLGLCMFRPYNWAIEASAGCRACTCMYTVGTVYTARWSVCLVLTPEKRYLMYYQNRYVDVVIPFLTKSMQYWMYRHEQIIPPLPLLSHPPSKWPIRVREIVCLCTFLGQQFCQTKTDDSAFCSK